MIDWMKIYKKTILRLFLQLKMPEYLINAPFVTRAKCLLIIVGDERLLNEDKNWGQLIPFIKNNGGYKEYATQVEELNHQPGSYAWIIRQKLQLNQRLEERNQNIF